MPAAGGLNKYMDAFDFRSLGGDKLRSRLLIKNVADDDYRGSYECWMVRSAKWADTALVRFKPGK